MKVMILKVSGKKAIAVNDKGEFLNIPAQRGMQAGVAFEFIARPALGKTFLSAAAVFLVLILGGLAYSFFSVTSYVDVNINPGVRMSVNILGCVVSIEGINIDGRNLIAKMQPPFFNSLENELKQIIETAYENNSLERSGKLLITIADDDQSRAASHEKELLGISFNSIKKKNLPVQVSTQKISIEAFKLLREEQTKMDDSQKRDVYDSKNLYLYSDGLFIGKAETTGVNQFKIVFSKGAVYNSSMQIMLYDADGNNCPVQLINIDENVWTLKSLQLKENGLYQIAVKGLPDTGELYASFLYDGKVNSDLKPDEKEQNQSTDHEENGGADNDESIKPCSDASDEPGDDDSNQKNYGQYDNQLISPPSGEHEDQQEIENTDDEDNDDHSDTDGIEFD